MEDNRRKLTRPKDLPYPKVRFENFYTGFKGQTVHNIVESSEWKDAYSHFYEFNRIELEIPIGETTHDLDAFSQSQIFVELAKIAQNFEYFCHRYVKILHPKHGTIPFVLYKYQRKVIDQYSRYPYNMVSKFRQGGLTTVAVLWGLWQAMFQTDKQIYVLSKTDREALAAGDIAKKALDNFPWWMYDPKKADISKHEKAFYDMGSRICFYTPEAARGKSASLIIIDEAAFIPDMYEHWKAMYPVIATGGNIAVVSTVNGMGNWYEETYHEAEAGQNFFKIIDLEYWEHPVYANPEWAKQTRANMTDKAWRQEVLRDFLSSGETYVPPNVIGHLEKFTKNNIPLRTAFSKWTNKNPRELTKTEDWENGALWIWQEPLDGHEYIIGVDCAEGVGAEGDNSCFEIIDISTLEQVAEFYSNEVPPHIFAQILNQIGIYYNTALVVVENMSVGGAVLSALQNDLSYENLYYDPKSSKQLKTGIKVGPANRPVLLEVVQQRLVNSTVRINSKRLIDELKTFEYNTQKRRPEARKNKHDDAIMALSLALFVRDQQMRGIPVGSEVPEEMTKIFKTDIYEEIKREILEGTEKDWISEDTCDPLKPQEIPTTFKIRRKLSHLIEEFGW
jgi:hypothetical protein